MKNFLTLCTAGLMVFLSACQTENKEKYTRQLEINSVPEGATIIVDGFKLGKTPLTISAETNDSGCFVRKTVITAIPQKESFHTHVKTFPAFLASDPDKSIAPESITFYMEKNPADSSAVILNKD